MTPSTAKPEATGYAIDLEHFPGNTYWALFDDEPGAKAAAQEIAKTDVTPEDMLILEGPGGLQHIHPPGHESGLISKLVRYAQELGDFQIFLEACEKAISTGKALLVVRFVDDDHRGQVERLTRIAGGKPLAFTSRWTFTEYA
ncbi:MAG: hypothetical protein GC160_00040 [Acidobacteria bacterium]|nr:hypothetical protein [Acidobacteriota bacterium]